MVSRFRGFSLGSIVNLARHSILYRFVGVIWGHPSYGYSFVYLGSVNSVYRNVEILDSFPVDSFHASSDFVPWAASPIRTRVRFVATDATVDTFSGRIYNSELKFLADSSSWNVDHALLRWPAPLPRLLRGTKANVPQAVATFIPNQTFFHFLFEDLPSLIRIAESHPETFVFIRENSHKYIYDVIDALGLKHGIAPPYLKVSKLVFESRGPALIPQKTDLQTLVKWGSSRQPSMTPSPELIYISRRDAKRMPSNEFEVERLVERRGFEIVTLSSMTLDQQIALFRSSALVVGTHGAGLSNLAWINAAHMGLIEIRYLEQPDCFEILAQKKQLRYSKIESSSRADWKVDLTALDTAIDAHMTQFP